MGRKEAKEIGNQQLTYNEAGEIALRLSSGIALNVLAAIEEGVPVASIRESFERVIDGGTISPEDTRYFILR